MLARGVCQHAQEPVLRQLFRSFQRSSAGFLLLHFTKEYPLPWTFCLSWILILIGHLEIWQALALE